jgi:hypothetical protein
LKGEFCGDNPEIAESIRSNIRKMRQSKMLSPLGPSEQVSRKNVGNEVFFAGLRKKMEL